MSKKYLILLILLLLTLLFTGLYIYKSNSLENIYIENEAQVDEEFPMSDDDLEKYLEEEASKSE